MKFMTPKDKLEVNNMEKGAVTTIVFLVLGVVVLLGVAGIFFKGTSTADPFSVLSCFIAGGKDCELGKEGAKGDESKKITEDLQKAIKCAYTRCYGESGVQKGCTLLKTNDITWGDKGKISCFREFCKGKEGPLCGEDSEKYPVTFQSNIRELDVIKLHPKIPPNMYFNSKCDFAAIVLGEDEVSIEERLLINGNGPKDCDQKSGGEGERGRQKECRLKSDVPINIYHKATGAINHIILCSTTFQYK